MQIKLPNFDIEAERHKNRHNEEGFYDTRNRIGHRAEEERELISFSPDRYSLGAH